MTRLNSIPVFGLALFVLGAAGQAVTTRSVYILPMTGGLDQYLADRITREHVMQVVADPKIADVVMTDRLNEAFEQTLVKLHPRKDETATEETQHAFRSSGNKGTLFLVDTKSRQVVWSDYEKPLRNTSGPHLSQEAGRIVKKLQGTPATGAAK
jgi:hypothetical protein